MLEKAWYSKAWWLTLLLPFALLFQTLTAARKKNYLRKQALLWSSPVPIIVIGNINVGGTGKTPLLMSLASYLQQQSFKVGVISRGYGGKSHHYPLSLTADSKADECGDEPLMIYQRLNVPVVVDPDRVRAAKQLLANWDCDVILSDDGLQHYNLQRDIELAVIDAERGLGNGYCLPAGPLREPPGRLRDVDMIVVNGAAEKFNVTNVIKDAQDTMCLGMALEAQYWVNCKTGEKKSLEEFYQQFAGSDLHAVAAIGNPDRFFSLLTRQHYTIIPHRFADHFSYRLQDLQFNDDLPVVMTEKDKVKCRDFATESMWYLQVESVLSEAFYEFIGERLQQIKRLKRQ